MLCALALVFCGQPLFAQAVWTGALNNDWSIAANWFGGIAPSPGGDVIISGSTNLNIMNVPSMTLNNFTINATGMTTLNGAGTIITNTSFNVLSDLTIANNTAVDVIGTGNVAMGVTLALSGGTAPKVTNLGGSFTVNGTILVLGNTAAAVVQGSDLQYSINSTLHYQFGGIATQQEGAELPAMMDGNVIFDMATTIDLRMQANVTINGTFTFQQGAFNLNGNSLVFNGAVNILSAMTEFRGFNGNLTIGGAGAVTGTWNFPTSGVFADLTMNRMGATLVAGHAMTVNNTLNLSAGKIDCATNNALLMVFNTAPTAIVGGNADSYVITNGTGFLRREIPNGTPGGVYLMPVGTAAGYLGYAAVNPTFSTTGPAYLMAFALDVTPSAPITSTQVVYNRAAGMLMSASAGLRLYSSSLAVAGASVASANAQLPLSAYSSLGTMNVSIGQFVETINLPFTMFTQWLGLTGMPTPPYIWAGALGANWQAPSSWSPARNNPAVTDELIFPAGTHTPTNIPHQTIAKLTIQNGATVTFSASNPTNWLTTTAMPDGVVIESGGTLDLGAPATNIALDIAAGSRCLVQGTLQTQHSAVIGAGIFRLDANGLLATMRDDGINGASVSGGAVQTASANYDPQGSYEFTSASPGAERDMNFRQQGGKNSIFQMLGLYIGASAGTRRLNSNISIAQSGEVIIKGRTTLHSALNSQIVFPFPFPRCTLLVRDGAELWNNGSIFTGDGADIIVENAFFTMVGPNGGGGTGSGNIAGSTRMIYSGASMLSYTGGGTFTTDDEILPISMPVPVWVSNATVVSLNSNKTLQMPLTLSSGGKLALNDYNLTINGMNTSSGGALRGATLSALTLNGALQGGLVLESGFGTLNSLTLNHAGAPIPALSGQVNILGTLTLQSGILAVAQPNTLTLGNSSPSAISGGSVNSYIQGALRRTMQAGITSDGLSYAFPVGDNVYRPFTLANVRTGGVQPVVQGQSFASGAASWSQPLTAGQPQNWLAQTLSGNFLTGTFQTSTPQSPIPSGLRVATAAAQNGPYGDIGADDVSQPRSSLPQAASVSNGGTYFSLAGAVPSIISFTPRVARPGQTITITGQFLASVTGVSFGGIPAASFTIVSPTQITAVVGNSGATGALTVQSPLGTAVAPLPFTWTGQPTISSVTPQLLTLGQVLTIRGTEYHTTPFVTIGGLGAASVTAASLTELRVVFTQATAGILTIVASGGTVSWQQPFTVLAPPRISTVSTLQPLPGAVFTISGSNFVPNLTQVSIGGVQVPATVNSPTQISVVAPQSANAPLVITTPAGTVLSSSAIVVIPPPTISAVTPLSALVGDALTITGTNYINTQSVSIGGILTTFVAHSPTSITAIAPFISTPTSQATVSVTTRSGTAIFSRQVLLRQAPDPVMTLTAFTPAEVLEGQEVLVSGVNVPNTAVVRLQSRFASVGVLANIRQASTGTVGNTPAEVRFITPSGLIPQNMTSTLATVIAEANFSSGAQTAQTALPIKILAPDAPGILGFSPTVGGSSATVIVSGVNFGISTRSSIQAVFIGGLPVHSFTVLSPTQIRLQVGRVQSGALSIQTGSGLMTTTASFTFNPLFDAEPVLPSDSLALNALYAVTKGASWTTSTNWTNGFPVALRFGVKVERGRVVEISLPANNLDSTLPWVALAQLTALRTLRIAGNVLGGSIAHNICSMTALQTLDLSGNRFEGGVEALCCLPAGLQQLNISNNRLTGFISDCLRQITALQDFDASGNQFIGGFPSFLVQMPQMQSLNLRGNRLSGSLPSAIGQNVGQNALLHGSNKLAQTSAVQGLQRLDISRNLFTGTLPQELGNLTALRELALDSNAFAGAVPEALGNITGLQTMTIAGNSFTAIPNLARTAPRLTRLDVRGNRLLLADLERLAGVPSFDYAPQRITPPLLNDTIAVIDAPFVLRAPLEGAFNRFRWVRNGSEIRSQAASGDVLEFAAFAAADSGLYRCEITNTRLPLLTVSTATVRVRAVLPNDVPGAVVIIAPQRGEIDVPTLPLLQWTSVRGAAQYRMEFSRTEDFASLLTMVTVVQTTTALVTGRIEVDTRFLNGFPLQPEVRYFWRVRAENVRGGGVWAVSNFTTAPNSTLGAQQLDFGKVPRYDTAFAILTVRNLSNVRIRFVDDATTSLPAFVCESLRGRELAAGESLPLRVRFIPTTLNDVIASLTLRFLPENSAQMPQPQVQSQTLTSRLLGRGGALKLIPPAIDTSLIGMIKLFAVQVVNVGDREAELLRVSLVRGAREYTYRADVDGAKPIGVGDTTAVLLKFVAERTGAASQEMILCQADVDTVTAPLTQFGRTRRTGDVVAGIGLRTIPPQAPPGAAVMLELYLTGMNTEDRDALFRASVPFFTASVRFHRQVLVPDASGNALLRAVRTSAIRSTMQTYSIPTTFWNGRDSVLLRVPCRAVAGSTDVTPLVIEQLQWSNGAVQLSDVFTGAFRLQTSNAGGKRLIGSAGGKILASVRMGQNPARDDAQMTYTLLQEAPVEIVLLDSRGSVISRYVSELQSAGEYQWQASVHGLSSGAYMLSIRAGSEEVARRVEIVR